MRCRTCSKFQGCTVLQDSVVVLQYQVVRFLIQVVLIFRVQVPGTVLVCCLTSIRCESRSYLNGFCAVPVPGHTTRYCTNIIVSIDVRFSVDKTFFGSRVTALPCLTWVSTSQQGAMRTRICTFPPRSQTMTTLVSGAA